MKNFTRNVFQRSYDLFNAIGFLQPNIQVKKQVFFLLAFLFFGMSYSYAQTLTTDKLDYIPGETAYASGTGWGANESITLNVHEEPELHPDVVTNVTADTSGNFSNVVIYNFDPSDFGSSFTLTATGQTNGPVYAYFTDGGGDFSDMDFEAGDPDLYPRLTYAGVMGSLPVGDANSTSFGFPIPGADHGTSVESLQPSNLGLGQVVPFLLEFRMDSGACQDECMTYTASWNTKTTSNSDFGFDETLGVIAAFVDSGDPFHVDPDADATVAAFSWVYDMGNDEILGTIQVCGIDPGDELVVEMWLVLDNALPAGSLSGNIQTALESAVTSGTGTGACAPGDTINTGNQTVPLNQVGKFTTEDVDISITKEDNTDPVPYNTDYTYTLTVSNLSATTVANTVEIIDNLDPNTTYVGHTVNDPDGAPTTCVFAAGTLTCTTGFLNPSETFTIDITVQATGTTANSGLAYEGVACDTSEDLCNNVSITTVTDDTDPLNDSDDEPTGVICTLSSTTTQVDVLCFGASTGSIDLILSSGTAPYTFAWTTGDGSGLVATDEDQSGLTAGTYNVTITDANNCSTTDSVTITEPTDLTCSIIQDNPVSVFGGSDGQATVTPSGGTATYTYLWDNGNINATANDLTAGPHTVTVTDANNCTTTCNVTIDQPSNMTCSITEDNGVLCFDEANGQATVAVTGGVSPFTYAWDNAEATQTAMALTAGSHSVMVTDDNGATTTCSVTITGPSAALTASATATDASCNGFSDGSVDLIVSGGTAPYFYNWDSGDTTEDISTVTAGTYSVTITDTNGCTATTSATVNEPMVLTASTTATNVSCNGFSDGSADLTVGGGTAPYSFSWNNGFTIEDILGLTAGTYTVTVTDAKGCTTTDSITITEPIDLTCSIIQDSPVSVFGGNDGQATVTPAGGTAPYTYAWDTTALNFDDVDNLVDCGSAFSLTSYTKEAWIKYDGPNDQNNIISGRTSNPHALWAPAGTMRAGHGSPFLDIIDDVPLPINAWVHYALTYDGSNGTWHLYRNGTKVKTTIDPATAGFTLTDVYIGSFNNTTSGALNLFKGQLDDVRIWSTVRTPAEIEANYNQCLSGSETGLVALYNFEDETAVNSASTGSIYDGTLVGVNPSTDWVTGVTCGENTLQTVSDLTAGPHTVTVTDANGCVTTCEVTIGQPDSLTCNIVEDSGVLCFGDANGQATVTPMGGVGPFIYAWDNTETTQTATALTAGSHSVTVTDDNGATTTCTVMISGPSAALTASGVATDALCFGEATGSIDLTVTGGSAPYSYAWTGPNNFTADTDNLFDLEAGTYMVSVTDVNGCKTPTSITVGGPSEPLSPPTGEDTLVACQDGNGVPDYEYVYNGQGWTGSYQPDLNSAWPYISLGRSDATGTPIEGSKTLFGTGSDIVCSEGDTPIDNPSTVDGVGAELPDGKSLKIVNISDENVILKYWDIGDGSSMPDGYSCACFGTGAPDVILAPGETITVQRTGPVIAPITGGTAGAIQTLTATATPPDGSSLVWYDAETGGNEVANPEQMGIGTSMFWASSVDDQTGCESPTRFKVTLEVNAKPDLVETNETVCYEESYTWPANGVTYTESAYVTIPGEDCEADQQLIFRVTPRIVTSYTRQTVLCYGDSTAWIDVSVTGGTGDYTYSWTGPNDFTSTEQDISNLAAGVYLLTVTDAIGCTDSISKTITQPDALTCSIQTDSDPNASGCQDNVTATVTPSGGVGPYTYLWDNGESTATALNLSGGEHEVVVTDENQCSTTCTILIPEPCSVQLSARMFLQGAYDTNTGLMNDNLRANGVIPVISPYGDNMTLSSNVFNAGGANGLGSPNDNIVDWVWVELRASVDTGEVMHGQSALVQRDGDIVDVDGLSDLIIPLAPKSYYVVVKHRNHLGAMSASAIALSETPVVVDFRDTGFATYGNYAQTFLGSGYMALWTGNVDNTGTVKFIGTNNGPNVIKDHVLADPSNGFNSVFYSCTGYLAVDIDMNGVAKFLGTANDSNTIKDNVLQHPGNAFGSVFYTISTTVPPEN